MTAAVANWVHALYDIPVLYSIAYPLWMIHGVAVGLLLTVAGTCLPPKTMPLVIAALALVFGALSIILSRPLAAGRNEMPVFIRYLDEGWWGFVDYGPWVFRFSGSASVGLAFGMLSWLVASNLTAAIIVGLGVGLALWVWTWPLFPEIEE